METKTKGQTFVGFAMRTGKYRIGSGAIETLKRADLIIRCKSAAENSIVNSKKFAKKFHCPCLVTVEKTLEEITHKDNAKVMAIYDKKLAKAILDNLEKDFILDGSGEV